MDDRIASLVVDLVEKIGLLRRDMQQKGDAERYEARWSRVDQKLSALAQGVSESNPDLAKQLRAAFMTPARSLAFRNAAHQKPDTPAD
jgi:hypothetical protein